MFQMDQIRWLGGDKKFMDRYYERIIGLIDRLNKDPKLLKQKLDELIK